MSNLSAFWDCKNGGFPALIDDVFADFEKIFRNRPAAPLRARGARILELDLAETPDSFVVTINVPGVARDNISVELEGEHLTISVQEAQKEQDKDTKCHYKGREPYVFKKGIKLPAAAKDVEASLKDGVLTITLKKNEVERARKIEIK